jgi:major membrane immunogen (membrane-anchored lipoprotein)
MQRSILLLGLCLMVLLSACKKNYKCVCTATNGTVEYAISETKKKEAQSSCDVYNKQWSGTLSGSCVLQEVPTE